MSDLIMGFYTKAQRPRRCSGCNLLVGGESPWKRGFEVRSGPAQGFYHSKQCYEKQLAQKKE